MVKQEVTFIHDPARIRSAARRLVQRRFMEPKVIVPFALLLALLLYGVIDSTWSFVAIPVAAFTVYLLVSVQYVTSSPRYFCGVEMQLAVREDGVTLSGANRSSVIEWAGIRGVYQFGGMWALFVQNSDAVTYLPAYLLRQETRDFMLAKLRESEVRVA